MSCKCTSPLGSHLSLNRQLRLGNPGEPCIGKDGGDLKRTSALWCPELKRAPAYGRLEDVHREVDRVLHGHTVEQDLRLEALGRQDILYVLVGKPLLG